MNMTPIGQAQPVLLLQTTMPDSGLKGRADFGSDKEFIRYLKKIIKEKAKKPEEKKDAKKTFNYWEVLGLLLVTSIPVATVQIAFGYAAFKVIRVLAGVN